MDEFGITPHMDYHYLFKNIFSHFGSDRNHFLLDYHNNFPRSLVIKNINLRFSLLHYYGNPWSIDLIPSQLTYL